MGIAQKIRDYFGQANWPRERGTDPQFYRIDEVRTDLPLTASQAVPVVEACANLISGQLADCPRHVEQNGQLAEGHPLGPILASPSMRWDPFQVWAAPIRCLLLNGGGYWIVKRSRRMNNLPVELVPAIWNGTERRENRIIYTLAELGEVGHIEYSEYAAVNVVAAHWHSYTGLRAYSPIRRIASAQVASLAQMQMNRVLQRARNASPIIQFSTGVGQGGITQKQVEAAIQVINDEQKGVRAALERNNMALLPPGTIPGRIESLSQADALLIEILRWTVEDISRIYGISPARLSQMSGGGAGVRVQAFIDQVADFERFAVAPVAAMLDAALTSTMLTRKEQMEGYRIRTDTQQVSAGSARDKVMLADQAVARAGVMTPNEARQRYLGLPPIEGGDQLLSPKGSPMQNMDGADNELSEEDD